MRAFAVTVIMGLVVLSCWNWRQIQDLRKEVAELREAKTPRKAVGVGDHAQEARDLVDRAIREMKLASAYIEDGKPDKAKDALDLAIQELDAAASLISDKAVEPASPVVDRLREAAGSARDTLSKRLTSKERADEQPREKTKSRE